MYKKRLIAFDGIDGSGKETQTKLLTNFFEQEHIDYKYLSFPTYNDDWSRHLNMYLQGQFGSNPESVNAFAASTFFASDRFCSFKLDWEKDYNEGKIILCNRYTTANAVHQLSKLPEDLWDSFIDWLYDYEFNKLGLPSPDLSIYLCVSPETAKKHIDMRSSDTNRKEDIHEKNFDHLKRSCLSAKYSAEKLGWKLIDCEKNGEMRSIDDIHNEVISIVKEWLKK